jgi:hypothetical protein
MRLGDKVMRNIFRAVIFILLTSLAACSIAQNVSTQISTSTDTQDAPVEQIIRRVETSAPLSTTIEPLTTQTAPMRAGQVLLRSRCTGCHGNESYEQIEKSPSEWEMILNQMIAMGVNLNDTEKNVLLNYLTQSGKR